MSEARFLALAGEAGAIQRLLQRHIPNGPKPHQLNRCLDLPNLVVFASPGTSLVALDHGQGLIIGRLLDRSASPGSVEALGPAQSRHALKSRGQSLAREYWGSYVAFLGDNEDPAAIRDPSAAIPIYFHQGDGCHIYCSHLELAEGLASPARVDEEFIRQWLSFPFLRTARSGLSGWSELVPGTAHSSRQGCTTIWSPWTAASAAGEMIEFSEAAERLRSIALKTVPALVADVDRPVLELSGGLDSSIVAACLKQAAVPVEAVNFVTRLPDGDERRYARLAARSQGIDLIELHEDELPIELVPPRPSFRPPLSPALQPLNRARAEYARSRGGVTFITGAGGDNLFCYLTTAAPVLDALRDAGPRAALKTLGDVAELGECSYWKAAAYAFRKAARPPFRKGWQRDTRFLEDGAAAASPDPHPWLKAPRHAPPGKREHLASLVRALHFLEASYGSGDEVRHPLLNQPLIEACLAVPTWLWVKDGRNRSVARAAFAGLLPAEVIHRRTKGRLESMCARAFAASRRHLADLLLDGELASRGLLDHPSLAAYLGSEEPPRDDDYFRVFDLASMELWLCSWRV